jgi:benzylsuccinate CoA-transferase BbsF subunit
VVFGNANAGKLGVALDMGRPEARAVAADLCQWADVVIESYSPGVMARWGLDYASLGSERPELIMISSCLNGQTGPAAGLAGFGNTGAALAGFTHLGGWTDALPIGPFGPYTDYLAPRLALSTLLGALEVKDRTGVGCYLDVSQVEGGVYFLAAELAEYFATGRVAERLGNASLHHAPHGVYACRQEMGLDRFLAIAVTDDCQWEALARLLGLAPVTGPPTVAPVPFATVSDRLSHQDEIDRAVAAWCRGQLVAEAETTLQALGIPAHRSANSEDFVTDPQLAHLGHLVRLSHAMVGETTVEGPRYRLEATPGRVERAAPLLGEHNVTVLRDLLGYADAQIEALVSCGALQ